MGPSTVLKRLETLAGQAPTMSTTVRTLARYAANSQCALATLGFASRVDFDRLLRNTRYEVSYGQSPFAFWRGNLFEDRLRQNGYVSVFTLLHQQFGYPSSGRVANLRVPAGSVPEHERRARKTEVLVAKLVRGDRDAPNLIDGAVLTAQVGGLAAYFEVDAVAARFDKPIHVGEVKSFPTVDGQADPEKVGSAVAQLAIYIVLLRRLVEKLGGEPKLVSTEALLITPRNTGIQPTLTVKGVGREVERAERILDHTPGVLDLVGKLPP